MRFLIYSLSDHEIIDPDTNESLGFLEFVKGTGSVVHIQDKMCTIESDRYETSPPRIIRTKPNVYTGSVTEERITDKVLIPFEDVVVGDLAKPI